MKILQNFILGNYIYEDSFLHKLDPRSKLIFSFIFFILIFKSENLFDYLFLLFIIVVAFFISKISIIHYIKGLVPLFWLLFFTAVLHIFTTKEGTLIVDIGIMSIYDEGLHKALFVVIKISLIIFISSLLTLTTTPLEITAGLEKLFYPLYFIKIPVGEIALMMSIAIRFIPILMNEANKIIVAQKARGAVFNQRKILPRINSIISIIIPLFVSILRKADDLAIALEARGFEGKRGNTRLNSLSYSYYDMILLLITIIILFIFKRLLL